MAKLRMEITKGDEVRFIAHLDYARAIERAIRRANLPAAYSEGFNPHMKLAFASALGVGVASDVEYVDIELTHEVNVSDVLTKLGSQFPSGITVKRAKYMPAASPALMAIVNLAIYSINIPIAPEANRAAIEASVTSFNNADEVLFIRHSPKGKREIHVKEFVRQVAMRIED
ncbi:MAG: TIGR03936 family radical SAM-associated protein, partial [Negativicutes bacterium]|nr:TIGR03936 family radical SAM-associated protein [Negativicutes bacterium]